MFLTRNGLKKLMTAAYKGNGLRVKNDGQGISITGAKWSVYFLHDYIPKETLGDLIAMVGQIPACEEMYSATKDGNQMEIYDDQLVNAMEAGQRAEYEMEKLPIIMTQGLLYGVLQKPDFEKPEITLVNYTQMNIVNPGLVDADNDEEPPEGPLGGGGTMVEGMFMAAASWHNNRMGYSIGFLDPIDDYGRDIIKCLESLRLFRALDGGAAQYFGG